MHRECVFGRYIDLPCKPLCQSILSSTTDFHLRLVVSYDFVALTEEDRIYDLTCSYTSKNVSVEAHYDTV
ncbi:unnamed protein product [Nippostrongylus brasiliensis]|uniref:ZP domain-containing protein n=1 Tax=Nippostrongylus brasiliensis TaxID=27835 RepID=A0A0N4XIK3_NIPBR|nr:unnamed protein product [Nippostrongylus brasiliensis]